MPAMKLPELSEADGLVQSRNHLQSDGIFSCLNRALLIAERVDAALSESVLARIAFIHQQRGDYRSESSAISDILKHRQDRKQFWNIAQAIANHRCDNPMKLIPHSIRDLATHGILTKSTSSITRAIANVGSGVDNQAAALGVLHLLNGWVQLENKSTSNAALSLRASIRSLSSPGTDAPLHGSVLLAAQFLLAQCLGSDHPESRAILERSLEQADHLGLPSPSVLKIETMRLLAECFAHSGEAIFAEGLLRSGLSALSRLPFLSAPELATLQRLRLSYAGLLRKMEWNGVKRDRDADRILAEGHADHQRCPYTNPSCSDKIPDFIAQMLVAE